MRTSEAVTPVPSQFVAFGGFTIVYIILAVTVAWLAHPPRAARRCQTLAPPPGPPLPDPVAKTRTRAMPWPDPRDTSSNFANGAILLARCPALRAARRRRLRRRHLGPPGRGPRAAEQRKVIAHAIGPIWEANHVWLIFVIVLVFTVFPPVFAALSIALYIPLSLALLGIVFRGAAFIFRTPARNVATGGGVWDRVFAVASTVTPVFFGMAAGAVASGQIRLESGMPVSDPWRTWLAPFPLAIGLLALATCAYLAAVYLTLETTGELQEDFRRARARGGCRSSPCWRRWR